MHTDRPLLGIFLMLGFCFVAPLADGISKFLGDSIPVGQIVLARFGIQGIVLLPVALWLKRTLKMSARLFALVVLRTLLHIGGVFAMITSLLYLPLADALAIAFVMPFIMLFLGWAFLGETVGWHRFAAVCLGFVGTVMVFQPSFLQVGWPAVLPLIVAVVFSFFVLVTRQIANQVDPIALQAVGGLVALPVLLPLLLWGAGQEIALLSLIEPDSWQLTLLCAVGLLGTIGHLFMTWSLRFAPTATLAPIQYAEIPFATLIGWLLFRDFPNGMAALGISLSVAAGIYIIFREQANARVTS